MYLIFDSETQIHRRYGRLANPFLDENYVVARGWKKEGDERNSCSFHNDKDSYLHIDGDVTVLVGHNIKFDLLYEMAQGNPMLRPFYKRGGRVWDTQLAEYLLQGMVRKYHMNSLDQIIESYGGRKKIDGMKELWAAGVQTSDIDPALVTDYLIGTEGEQRNSGDIGNTELVYLGQIALAEELGMTKMIQTRMDSLCATTEMEFNGIHVDYETAGRNYLALTKELDVATKKLDEYIQDIPDEVGFKWSSPVCKSAILFGGTIRYQKPATYIDEKTGENARLVKIEKWPLFDKEPVDPAKCVPFNPDAYEAGTDMRLSIWRNDVTVAQDANVGGKNKGAPKFRNVKGWGAEKTRLTDFFWELPGYVNPKELEIKKTKSTDGAGKFLYSTDSDTIELLGHLDVPFLKAMSRKSELDKEIGTYYFKTDAKGERKGMLTCMMPNHIVHHSLNHTSTVTSRLSSSNPNCQNIPRKDKSRVKEMFNSRFKNGVMGELDYSQLEVVVQGFLTGDKQLVADLLAKVDFHCKRVAMREHCTYEEALLWCKDEDNDKYPVWTVFRTECKIFSFQLAYGAGASTIAITAGMSKSQVEDMIVAENKLYPGVNKFNDKVMKAVEDSAEAFRDGERGYKVYRRGTWQSPTGTLFSWRSWDAPAFMKKRGITDTFSPPEIKNYPTQGTGGEFVQLALGFLWRHFMRNDNWGEKALLVNTVHDCFWLDIASRELADIVIPQVKKIMEAIPHFLKHIYGIDCPVPFPADAEVGKNMWDLHHFTKLSGETT